MSDIKIKLVGIEELKEKLDYVMSRLDQNTLAPEYVIYDNNGLLDLLKISASKAAELRNTGKISFSKESLTGKIWYRLSDILEYLDSCYHKKF